MYVLEVGHPRSGVAGSVPDEDWTEILSRSVPPLVAPGNPRHPSLASSTVLMAFPVCLPSSVRAPGMLGQGLSHSSVMSAGHLCSDLTCE